MFGSAGDQVVGRGSPGFSFSFSDIPQTQIGKYLTSQNYKENTNYKASPDSFELSISVK